LKTLATILTDASEHSRARRNVFRATKSPSSNTGRDVVLSAISFLRDARPKNHRAYFLSSCAASASTARTPMRPKWSGTLGTTCLPETVVGRR